MRNDSNKSTAERFRKLFLRVVLICILITMVFPLLWTIMSSLKTNQEYMSSPLTFPSVLAWDNYARAVETTNMFTAIKNSAYVVLVSLVTLLVCAVPCSIILVRYRTPVIRSVYALLLGCLFINASYIIIPLFLELRSFKLLNNLTALGVLYGTFQLPYSIFLLTGYMREIPRDYEEAAILDGCSPFGVMRHIVIPLSKSIIFTVSMICILSAWGEYIVALVMVTKPGKLTFPVSIAKLYEVAKYATDWGALFAALTISLLPTLALFLVGEKYAIKGMSIGGLKG